MLPKIVKIRKLINAPYTKEDIYVICATLLILVAIPFTVWAIQVSRELRSRAAVTVPTMFITPTTLSVQQNTAFTVEVREDSLTQPVNAVLAVLTYDATRLDFVSIDDSTSPFTLDAETTTTPGSITIARAVESINGQSPAPLTGERLIARVTFMTKALGGTTSISFDAESAMVGSATNTDIMVDSPSVTYTITDPAPTVSLTAPANNASIRGTVGLTATASDNIGVTKVDFLVDGAVVGTDTSSPYNFNLNTTTLTNASHTIAARATDTGNNTSTSQVTVTVDNQAPTVSITSPANNATVQGTVTVSVTAADNSGLNKVELLVDGNIVLTDTTSPYSFSWNSGSVTQGAHVLVARATDNAGNVTNSGNVNITVQTPDAVAPTVSITAPGTGTVVRGTITVSATANDNVGVTKVEFLDGTTILNTDTTSPYSFSLNTTTLSNSNHTLGAKAYDAANNSTTATVVITVDNQVPTTPGTISVTHNSYYQLVLTWGPSTDNGTLAGYEVYRNNVLVTTVSAASYTDSTLSATTAYTYFVRARDAAGNQSAQTATLNVTTRKIGDLNGDGLVNIFDLSQQLSKWMTTDINADLNKSGKVDIFDLSMLLSRWAP